MDFLGSHILSVDQFTPESINRLFTVAEELEPYAMRQRRTRVLEGAVLGNLFFEPSTRTRISFAAAFSRLGGNVCNTTGFAASSFTKGESIFDTSRVVSGYCDVLVVRHPEEGSVREFADATNIPVLNGGDGPGEHPSQALLDLYTICKETGREPFELTGTKVALVGDLKHGRTVHSLSKLLSMFGGIEFRLISPQGLEMPEAIVRRIIEGDNTVTATDDMEAGIAEADIIYMTRIQEERFHTNEEAQSFKGRYAISSEVYQRCCKPSAVLMHPLPRDSRPGARELNPDLNEHPNLAIFRQADNGIVIRMALYVLVLGVENQIHDTAEEVCWFVPEKVGSADSVILKRPV